ncbi:MAG TPA: FGGY-family carbohydrate kinase, partial [Propionicimonas sp.]
PGYVCLGTSAWYACTTTEPVLDAEERSFNLCHVVPGLFTPTATTQTGAGSVQWAAEALAEAPDEIGRLISDASAALAADEDLYFLPYLIGERSPWWDAKASGTFVGLRMHHRRPNLTRAVLEGVGYSLALCMAPLRTSADAGIDVIGGGAASDTWLALLADIWSVPVRRRSVTNQANSLGAAVTGLVGLGEADFTIASTLSSVEAEFVPGPGSAVQTRHLARFSDAYRALSGWFAASGGSTP